MLSTLELRKLQNACDQLPDGRDYRCDGYLTNIVDTVLDFQMRVESVNAACRYFDGLYGNRSHRWLKSILKKFPDTKKGNLALSNFLWQNNHWTRAKFLRVLFEGLDKRGIRSQKDLARWLKKAEFNRDIRGQFKSGHHSVGFAIFHWLCLRCGIDTIKPDLHVRNFVEQNIERKVTAEEAAEALITIAQKSRRKAFLLDSAIWQSQRDRSGSASIALRAQ